MKRFLIICAILLVLSGAGAFLFLYTSLDFSPFKVREQQTAAIVQGKQIYLVKNGKPEPFEIKGVDLGAGIPGHFATEFAIDYDTYIEWFALIKAMNANTIRIYTISDPIFYQAFYDYNLNNPDPLYLIHGVWVDDGVMRASNDAYADKFIKVFQEDCRIAVDVIHGRRSIGFNGRYGYGAYKWNISPWVLGYIIGVEWEPDIVLYTNDLRESSANYQGEYLYTAENATAFEAMLARVGDAMVDYEMRKYSQQRLLAFSNWPETDPLQHEQWRMKNNSNIAHIDTEHILGTQALRSGMFASYHIYPYYPAFLDFEKAYVDYVDENGQNNPYLGYLRAINSHHSMPVVISEFGLPSSRGIARINKATGMNQGNLSEAEQAERLPILYENIKRAGCAGAIVFEWQDEWFKRTWNTWSQVDLHRNAYWSDYQTNEQSFGLITFDPGKTQSIVYVDGDMSEWTDVEPLQQAEGVTLKMCYDEKYLYFGVEADTIANGAEVLIPLDITPNSGALEDNTNKLVFSRPVDFVISIRKDGQSEVFVQQYYDCLYATERREVWGQDAFIFPPEKDSKQFNTIYQCLRRSLHLITGEKTEAWIFPTGKLLEGNGNPSDPDFNSLADYCIVGNNLEIRLPWQLLNFSDPSKMMIHDDYYLNYGVVDMQISSLYAGAVLRQTSDVVSTPFGELKLKGWGVSPTAHMRIKASYYSMQTAFEKE